MFKIIIYVLDIIQYFLNLYNIYWIMKNFAPFIYVCSILKNIFAIINKNKIIKIIKNNYFLQQ